MKTIGLALALTLAGATLAAAGSKGAARTYDMLGIQHEAKLELGGGKVAWLEAGTPVLLLKRRERMSLVMVPGTAGYVVGRVVTNSVQPLNAKRKAWGSALEAKLPAQVGTAVEKARTVRDVLSAGLVRRMRLGYSAEIVAAPGERRPRLKLGEREAVFVLGTCDYYDPRERDRYRYAYVLYRGATGYVDLRFMEELEPLPAKDALHERDPASMQLAAAKVERGGLLLYGAKGKALVALPRFARLKVVRETWDRLYVYAEGHAGGVRGVLSRDGLSFEKNGLNRWSRFSSFDTDASYFDVPAGLLGKEQIVEAPIADAGGLAGALGKSSGEQALADGSSAPAGARPVVQTILSGKIAPLLADAPQRMIPAGTRILREPQESASNHPVLFTLRTDVEAKVLGEATNSTRAYVYFKGATGYVELKDLR